VHIVPSLPLTPVGKVDRKALRAKVLEEATA
jgi:non-ribosomal peptide synthetase component E (peptide arylation enzyme)